MRFSKPFTVTLAGAALLALPLSGAALADAPKPGATAEAPQPAHAAPAKQDDHGKKDDRDKKDVKQRRDPQRVSLTASVNPSRVRAGQSYGVTIVVKGLSSGTATVTSPEGKSYRVALSGGRATKTLTVPSRTTAGSRTVTVKVGNRTATADFTVVGPQPRKRDDDRRHHVSK
ncbi:hypothetical protein MF672_008335 [Actinomadura sp. ATCC 31491]|uniref:Uncharacterized protein n=1 Tax=Actinomadura luzonensis TaxID=2805427 RepID=A0ABT0FP59_9ACTN|nr:hypothetical protein [Actinomadura luzonensis]MCK2213795.1 hypothetical protein [Actinomadura luzonensis]